MHVNVFHNGSVCEDVCPTKAIKLTNQIPIPTFDSKTLKSLSEKMKKLLVMSNKGGVGKTTIAVNLSFSLSETSTAGLLDIDLHGPDVPMLLGIRKSKIKIKNEKFIPLRITPRLYVMSLDFLIDKDRAVIWRGPLKTKAIHQLINDVLWPDLDFLVVDLPPGTGDESITVMQMMKDAGSIIVSTSQTVAVEDVKRVIDMSRSFNIPILGLIENMSSEVFGSGKVEELAKKERIPFLGRLSLDAAVSRAAETGKPFILEKQTKPAREFEKIVKNLKDVMKNAMG